MYLYMCADVNFLSGMYLQHVLVGVFITYIAVTFGVVALFDHSRL